MDNLGNFIANREILKLSIKVIDNQSVYQITTNDSILYFPEVQQAKDRNPEEMLIFAQLWCNAPISKIDTLYKLDQWIPFGRLKKDMPIYKLHFSDKQKHELYISSKSGEALQFTNKNSRFWAWIGAIPHWVYFTSLRQNAKLWSNTIIVLCIAGIVMCITGIILGFRSYIIQYKKRKKLKSPYKKSLYKWHHIWGFFFGLFVLTFIFSGMMSLVSVPDWIVKTHDKTLARKIMMNSSVIPNKYILNCNKILQAYPEKIKSIEWDSFGDIPLYKIIVDDRIVVLNASADSIKLLELKEQDVRHRFEKIHKCDVKISWMTKYDNYYLSRKKELPLPVFKIEVDDADQSVSYVDPQTGSTRYYNKNFRANKWTYGALHSYNIKLLTDRPWLWNIVMWVTMIGGTIVSFTGLFLALKYIKRKIKR